MTHQYSSKEKRKEEGEKSLLEPKQSFVAHTCHTII
jgi:hypothetical protein